jgi:head-tail adaptor
MLTENGFETKTFEGHLEDVINELQSVYGEGLDFASNTVQGQIANIQAKARYDAEQNALRIYNNLSLEDAEGVALDILGNTIFGIARFGASKTATNIQITVDRTITLIGGNYIVADNEGNRYILQNTTTINAGTHNLLFLAEDEGNINPQLETITKAITIIAGVVGINNTEAPLSIGNDVETDAIYRLRIKRSRQINASGSLNAVLSRVLNVDGVIDARVETNRTDTTQNTMSPHSTWVVVEGGINQDIGEAISNSTTTIRTKGAELVYVNAGQSTFEIRFDRPLTVPLFIQGSITNTTIDLQELKEYLVSNIQYKIYEIAESSIFIQKVREFLNAKGIKATAFNFQISRNESDYFNFLEPATFQEKFTLATANIDITIL